MRRTKAQAQQTREDLLHAALDVFSQRGVARASLSEIAQAAGVTRGALYWHFKNKEDLFDALFAHIFHDLNQQLDADIARNAPGMLQCLRQTVTNMFERLQHDGMHRKFCDILHLKCEHTPDNVAIVGLMNRYQQMWTEKILTILNLCIRQQALPAQLDAGFAAVYLKSAIFGLMHQWLTQPQALDLSATAARLVDATLHTLAHAPEMRQRAA